MNKFIAAIAWLVLSCNLFSQNPSLIPASVHFTITTNDSSYSEIFRFGLNRSNELFDLRFEGNDEHFSYMIIPKKAFRLDEFFVSGAAYKHAYGDVFCNGFQSGSASRLYRQDESQRGLSSLLKKRYTYFGDDAFYRHTKKKGVLHSWSYTYVERGENQVEMLASLDEGPGYTLFRYYHSFGSFRIERDCRGRMLDREPYLALSVYHGIGNESKIFDTWAALYSMPVPYRVPSDMQGWIADGTGNTASGTQVREAARFPSGLLLIGPEYPSNISAVVDSIHAAGKLAGITVAPFICAADSRIARLHPGWLLKNDDGKPLKAGFDERWGGWFYAYDIYEPDCRKYLGECMDTIMNIWGFDVLNAEHLFAAAIMDHGLRTRGEVMADAVSWLRAMIPGKKLIAGGIPLGSAFKRVDYCMVTSSVLSDRNEGALVSAHFRETPSDRNQLVNLVSRWQLNGRMFSSASAPFSFQDGSMRKNANAGLTRVVFSALLSGTTLYSDYESSLAGFYRDLYRLKSSAAQMTVGRIATGGYSVSFDRDSCRFYMLVNMGKRKLAFGMQNGARIEIEPRSSFFTATPRKESGGDCWQSFPAGLMHPSFRKWSPAGNGQ